MFRYLTLQRKVASKAWDGMRKRASRAAVQPASPSSDSDTAQADLFAADNTLAVDQLAQPSSRADADAAPLFEDASDSDEEDSEASSSEADDEDAAAESDAAGSLSEGAASDDDDVDTAIIDYAAAAQAAPETDAAAEEQTSAGKRWAWHAECMCNIASFQSIAPAELQQYQGDPRNKLPACVCVKQQKSTMQASKSVCMQAWKRRRRGPLRR